MVLSLSDGDGQREIWVTKQRLRLSQRGKFFFRVDDYEQDEKRPILVEGMDSFSSRGHNRIGGGVDRYRDNKLAREV